MMKILFFYLLSNDRKIISKRRRSCFFQKIFFLIKNALDSVLMFKKNLYLKKLGFFRRKFRRKN